MNRKVSYAFCLTVFLIFGCNSHRKQAPTNSSRTAAISVGLFTPKPGDPEWALLKLDIRKTDATTFAIAKDYPRSAFAESKLNDVAVKVEYGRYKMLLLYLDSASKLIYQSCPTEKTREHSIETQTYETVISICKEGSSAPAGEVVIIPSSEVTITTTVTDTQ